MSPGAVLAFAALIASPRAAWAGVDELLREEDVVSAPVPPRPVPPKTRTLEQLIALALRQGSPLTAKDPCAAALGIPSGWSARALRFKAPAKAAPAEREFVVYYGLEPDSGEARPQALLLGRHRIFPRGRTEYEERGCLRLSADGRLERASYGYGRVLMAENKLLDLESSRAKRLLSELTRFYLVDTAGSKPSK